MADNGMRFVGDATNDRVNCFYCASYHPHSIFRWELQDDPVQEHNKHYGFKTCLPPATHVTNDIGCKLL